MTATGTTIVLDTQGIRAVCRV
eukprot:COSAG02_NODE_42374_length_385_cov_0.716783_1_plen_21_part_01